MESDAGLYVSTAGTFLQDRESLQEHYKSEFHRYNLKRKIAGLPPVTREWYEARKAQLLATASQPVQKVWFDPLSKKKFYSENTYLAFTRSKKYGDLLKRAGGVAPAPIVTLRKLEAPTQEPAAAKPASKPTTVPSAAPAAPTAGAGAAPAVGKGFTVKPAVKAAGAAAAPADVGRVREVEQALDRAGGGEQSGDGSAEDAGSDWETASEEEMQEGYEKWEEWDVRRSLLDNTLHPSMEANLEYMFKKFGFYFPDAEYLVDPEGLLKYLGAKLQYGHVPLYESGDNPNAKQFASLHAVQRHMVDTNQCKMQPAYEEDEEEYADFYDYSAMDVDSGAGAGALIVSPEDAGGASATYELVLAGPGAGADGPGGGTRILGSREFARYYRQRPRLSDGRQSVQRATVLAEYRRLAIPLLADTSNELAAKKQNERRARRMERQRLAMGMRRNINDNLPKNGHGQQPSRVALLTDSQHLSILRWDACLQRLTAVQRFCLPPYCSPGLGGADAASNPYRLLAPDPGRGQLLAVAAALGTVAVFSLANAAGPEVACTATPGVTAAGTSATDGSGSGSGSRVCVTAAGSEEPSLILGLAWLGGGTMHDGQRQQQQQQRTLAVLHQPPGASPALSVYQWQCLAGFAPRLGGSRIFQLSDAPLCPSPLASSASRGAFRGLVAVPGAPDLLLLLRERQLLLLRVDTTGVGSGEARPPNGGAQRSVPPDWREHMLDALDSVPSGRPEDSWQAVAGPALVTPADCSSPITCWAWDILRDIPTTCTPAIAGVGGHDQVSNRTLTGPLRQRQQQQQQPLLLPAPGAPMELGSQGENDADLAPAPAPSGMLLDPAPESRGSTAAGAMQLGSTVQSEIQAQQEHQNAASWHSGHSAALLFGCEDGTLWRAELALHGGQGGWPSVRLHLCYEGDVPARLLLPLPEGRLLYCPDVRDARLLQLTRVPDTVTSLREPDSPYDLQPPRTSRARLAGMLEEVLRITLGEMEEAGGDVHDGGQPGLAGYQPAPAFWQGGGAQRLLAAARQWLGQLPPEQRSQFLHWFMQQGGMQARRGGGLDKLSELGPRL
ncbi:hypothetical protein N2152v2_004330 [Parachlorella kessleri]